MFLPPDRPLALSDQADTRALRVDALVGQRAGRRLWGPMHWHVGAGQALWLRGPNGSGKTTLLRCLAGLHRPEAGTVRRPTGGQWFIGHATPLAEALGAAHNLRLWLDMAGATVDAASLDAWLQAQGLPAARPVRQLSAGQRRKITLAPLDLAPRALWLLDEPFDALDDAGCQALAQRARHHLGRGGVLVLTSHQALPAALAGCAQLQLATAAGAGLACAEAA
ncbi:heme ABC exporter ATP-binding protein CcmA [Ideonella livida]|uniref:Heme ABC exporter ATP-binding protein CcmA n=1 Tax=Ideonella livida TaxID=2707176 RepID=A0A7C9PGQ3_9BURK|nr:heme ABC exporter ATP-binding protein CcmA [Ideonella livida]NDY91476.1 heme ABC exporter ATP-binding protein CcmA [Ideonella livida]